MTEAGVLHRMSLQVDVEKCLKKSTESRGVMTSENSSLKEVTLEDKYQVLQGTLYLTGIQALV